MMPSEADIRSLVRSVVEQALSEPSSEAGEIAIGSDHGGFALKERLKAFLEEQGHAVHDCGTSSEAAVDYPDFAHAVAHLVASGRCRLGIIIDGAGIGSAMVANKVPGVRAALCYDLSSARNSREHNHANVLTLGAGLIGANLAQQIVSEWIETPWGPDRHARRVAKITEIERRYTASGDGE
jgi:ribose 5-phosphate isomerase B